MKMIESMSNNRLNDYRNFDFRFNVISHASLPDTELIFRRRPATSSAL
jgi:hypothetical protein